MLNAQFFTDTGQHREKNEDAGGIFYNQTHQQLLVLCDGMGVIKQVKLQVNLLLINYETILK